MPSLLQIRSHSPIPAPDPLTLLAHLCESVPSDIVLLHSATLETSGLSVLAFDPMISLEITPAGIHHYRGVPSPEQAFPTPIHHLEHLITTLPFTAPHPLIGWLGFLSYDLGRLLEEIPTHHLDDLRWPLLSFTLYHHYLLFDSAPQTLTLHTLGNPQIDAHALLKSFRPTTAPSPSATPPTPITPSTSFPQAVELAKTYIAQGDIYQVNLSQRWTIPTTDAPHEIFRRLCNASPAPYSAFLRLTCADGITRHALSASPELFISVNDRHIITRPIKGTRPRDLANPQHDQALSEDLLASAKDHAELIMIVDLLRNDLGRVANFGSVQVTHPRTLEKHPTVWHTTATIEADVRASVGLAELLRALIPGGSITGAPKIRAMQLIEQLEPVHRNLYCGNIGIIAPNARSLTLSIAIRTILLQNNLAHVYAGCGIVADSDPMSEHEESLHKAAALFRALRVNSG